jgi:hypothetical protein
MPTDWASSQPHLALLKRFLAPRDAKDGFPDYWAPAFGMSPQRVIDGMVAHGGLEPVPLLEKIEICHTVAELKKILSSRGLKVSGKKAELVQRLLEADPKDMENLYAHRMILRCTPAASQAVSRWEAEQVTAFETAIRDLSAALHNRDFNAAIRVSDAYRESEFKPPVHPAQEAMTVHPAPRSIEERAKELATVFTMRLKSLEGLQPEQSEGIYLNYAVGQLLGRAISPAHDLLKIEGMPQDRVLEITRFLVNNAREQFARERQLSLGITHAIWMYPNAPCMKEPFSSCPTAADIRQDSAHRAANGKKYEIAKGLFVGGKWTRPGVEEGCKCASRSVLPWTTPGDAKPSAAMALWYRKCAEQGDAIAQYNLGLDSSTGGGVPQDYVEAYFWFDLAGAGKPQADLTKLALEAREEAASHLSPADLSRAQERVRKWRAAQKEKT